MNPTIKVDKRVSVVAKYVNVGDVSKSCIPCRMKIDGREVEFTELSLRHPTVQGKRMIHVFHMSDGANGYRLEFDAERLIWTLVDMIPGSA
jgi:hypothetical protein